MSKPKTNSEAYPECWAFFIEHARNMENTTEVKFGKYRVPKPDRSGDFLYNDKVEELFKDLKYEWYKPGLESPSVHGKIQYIVEHFSH
jgi:hypothetical protein